MTTPIDLFRMVMGDQVWTLTPVDTDQTYDAGSGEELYTATPMGRSDIEQKTEISKANLEVRIPIDHDLAVLLLTQFSEQTLTLTVFTKRDDEVEVSWKGRLTGHKPGDANITLNFESIFTSLKRSGLRARMSKSCRHALYGRGCNIDPETLAAMSTITAITGDVVSSPIADTQNDGTYIGGMLRATDGTLAYIIDHVGPLLTLQRLPYSLVSDFATLGAGGFLVTLYPGCDHSRSQCELKFNNLLNYGGFDWIPDKNPMGGNSIV